MNALFQASEMIQSFRAGSLRATIAAIEKELSSATAEPSSQKLATLGTSFELLAAAILIKKNSSQIDEIIHAVGILLALPGILEKGEIIESLSLAAGNTGKGFDLETNLRIAEFTFIHWQGGPEVIRQNKIFKDFYFLAEASTSKQKELYTIGTAHPKKFFNSRRALPAILDGNRKLGEAFRAKYGDSLKSVREYYVPRENLVAIRDITEHIPLLQ